LQSSDDGTTDVADEDDDETGIPPFARLMFMLLILGVIGASVYFLML
jgi:hypothetical protein